ncbi:hypothetical protein AZE42_10017 [Rhizopogon vesiculosus]|uniref:Uncharacterized protein n=1 Tax=Rhizopogon vesiculosus TaxID=180088 RepID=A0A1J8Q786_9AGAM|nr:hypothetical protein AZE42_10017 [Rhizopogon vesiculosus]
MPSLHKSAKSYKIISNSSMRPTSIWSIIAWNLWLIASRLSFCLWPSSSRRACVNVTSASPERASQQNEAAPENTDVKLLVSAEKYTALWWSIRLSRVSIIPIIRFTFEIQSIDLFDVRRRAISPNMWPIFELTYDIFKSDAVDFLNEILPLAGQLRVQPQHIIAIAADHIDKGETSTFLLANLDILINAVPVNASAALHFIDRESHAGPLTADGNCVGCCCLLLTVDEGFSEDIWHSAYLEILAKEVSADNPTAHADVSREPV